MEEVNELKLQFNKINAMGWVPAIQNRNNCCGVLFEKLLGKPVENFEIPDFKGIEIKTHTITSNCYITLFNANPEGKTFFEINRLCDTYGYPDTFLKECKVLHGDINCIEKKFIGQQYQYQLFCNNLSHKIELIIYDRHNEIVEHESFWPFNLLEEKLYRKLKTLAYIRVKRKRINQKLHFYYEKIEFYQLKDFQTFLSLIENGTIVISLSIGVFRKGPRKGQIHNHGVAFRIKERNLSALFTPISEN